MWFAVCRPAIVYDREWAAYFIHLVSEGKIDLLCVLEGERNKKIFKKKYTRLKY